jgi:adenosine deaminase
MAGLSDLHRHLDGSLRRATLEELAARVGVEVPGDVGFSAGMGLERALECFRLTLSVLQELDAVRRVASEMCEDAAADGVTTLEIRFAPQLHGKPVADVVDAALDGVAGRAGLVLCGLYGEAPRVLEGLVDVAAGRAGVVGIDLAGGPTPGHSWGMESYAGAYRRAAEVGIGRTVHAGEGRSAAEIGMAIEVLGAQRIGHGTTLLEDGSGRVLDLVLERGVTIEACPTSNVHTGVIRAVGEHPLPRWLELGVKACVNTDNTLFSRVTASEEYGRVGAIPGMSDALLARAVAHGHAARFVRA